MSQETTEFARGLESRLRPLTAAAVAGASGGRDSHGHRLRGLDETLAGIPDRLEDIRRWAETHCPAEKPGRRGGRG